MTLLLSELFARKLLGRKDIEDALKRLDNLIQEEFQMVTAQTLEVPTEVKDGTRPNWLVTNVTINTRLIGADNTNEATQQASNDTVEG